MTYSLEMIVNLGPYEHAKLTITEDSAWQLSGSLDDLDTELAIKIGRTAAALKGAVLHGRDNPEDIPVPPLDPIEPVEVVKTALGATVVAVEEHSGPVAQKPWERAVEAPSKPWENKANPSTLDDIFG